MHVTDGRRCWCDPELLQLCPACQLDTEPETEPDPGCWQCGGRGLVPMYDPDSDCVIVHRTIEEIINAAGIGREEVPD